jgi:hypothetical protein
VRPRLALAAMLAVLVTLAGNVAAPAWACACGAYIPDANGPQVVDEKALITWDGTSQDIVMGLGVNGTSEKAAWIMPVPSEAQVSLAERGVFERLSFLTRPRYEYRDSWWPSLGFLDRGDGAGAPGSPAGGIEVRGQQRIGPFDVTRLGGDDPQAVAKWLGEHGFPKPATLDQDLAPYVQQGWEIVAVQLVPAEGDELGGQLQPLRLRFASDEVVYPMRLSKAAEREQAVQLYVLADHRMDPKTVPSQTYDPDLRYAGPVSEDDAGRALAPYIGEGKFLTRWDNVIADPKTIANDYTFAQARRDTTYEQTITVTRDRGDVTTLAIAVLVVLVAIVILVMAERRYRRRTMAG